MNTFSCILVLGKYLIPPIYIWKAVSKDQPSIYQKNLFVPSTYQFVLLLNLTLTSSVMFTLLGAAGFFLTLCFPGCYTHSLEQYALFVVRVFK